MPRKIVRLADAPTLHAMAARFVSRLARETAQGGGDFSLALAGGSTPAGFHRCLAALEGAEVPPWEKILIFWGDERFVPRDHPASNYRMARETLLDHVPVPPGNVHPVPVEAGSPEAAAAAYEETLRRLLGPEFSLDLTVLGLGADGHTASLFPGSRLLLEGDRLVAAAEAPHGAAIRRRVTLTPAALNACRRVLFLVTGQEKREALESVLSGDEECPAGLVEARLETIWMVSEDAW